MTREEFIQKRNELIKEYKDTYKPQFKTGDCVGTYEYESSVNMKGPKRNSFYVIEVLKHMDDNGFYMYEVSDGYGWDTFNVSENEIFLRTDNVDSKG